ncbi:MAG TPA: HlyD family secretion protein [Rhodanobacter sp.]
MTLFRAQWGRILLTFAMLLCAVLLGRHLWDYYMHAPWTRDSRVSADVVRIAPEISGTILEVEIADNQFVRRGDVLYRIDPTRFQLAVEQAQANFDSARQAHRLKVSTARRRAALQESGAETAENIEQAGGEASIADADYRSAQVALKLAALNLERTTVRAPVDGYVTNLRLRPGDYATAGDARVTVLDAASFRVTGYFQETQLSRMRVGDKVAIRLMGFRPSLQGHIASFGRGIADSNSEVDHLGLPTVQPVFNWVRLAQRLPVRIHVDHVPDGVTLASGMTASLYVVERTGGKLATRDAKPKELAQ